MNNLADIDLLKLFKIIASKLWLIILSAVIFGGAVYGYTRFCVTPLYTSSSRICIKSYQGDIIDPSIISSGTVNYSEMTISQRIVTTYLIVLESNTVMQAIADASGLGYSAGAVRSMMNASAIDETAIINVSFTSSNPEHAAILANTVADVAPQHVAAYVPGSSAIILDRAVVPTSPSYPSYKRNVSLGVIIGAVFMCFIVVLRELIDVRIKSEEDLEQIFDLPILGTIPSFTSKLGKENKYGRGYYYRYENREINNQSDDNKENEGKEKIDTENKMGEDK